MRREDFPWWTDGKHVVSDRLSLRPMAPITVPRIGMKLVRERPDAPTRASWVLPTEGKEVKRLRIPSKSRLNELDMGGFEDSFALSRGVWPGGAFPTSQKMLRKRKREFPVNDELSKMHLSVSWLQTKDIRGEEYATQTLDPGDKEAPSCMVRAIAEEMQTKESMKRSKSSQDLIEFSKWLRSSGKELSRHRELGSLRLGL